MRELFWRRPATGAHFNAPPVSGAIERAKEKKRETNRKLEREQEI